MTRLVPGSPTFYEDHVPVYLETHGFEGHFVDMSPYGGNGPTTILLLKTVGRKSGQARLHPLIYDNVASEYVIIASLGGAVHHPAWYLNLTAHPRVEFQVADKCFRGTWRLPEGGERQRVWDQLADYFPPYAKYQQKTDRQIPIVMMTPTETIPSL
jgi:deazaflavin-dependent oxidoreductase (nitroreductase family)